MARKKRDALAAATERERQFLLELAWIQLNLQIVTKDGRLVPCRFNGNQLKLIRIIRGLLRAGRPVRIIILKARQLGMSTFIQAWQHARAALRAGRRCLLLSHQDQSKSEIWQMQSVFTDHRPGAAAEQERFGRAEGPLIWRNGSRQICATASGHAVGHGGTLTDLHLSECSRYGIGATPVQAAKVIAQAVGIHASLSDDPDSVEFIESTANGFGGWFHEQWQRAVAAESDFAAVFFPWWSDPGYRSPLGTGGLHSEADLEDAERDLRTQYGLDLEQLCWRRWAIANKCNGDARLFREQYPANPDEAFLVSGATVFDPDIVQAYLQQARDPIWRGELLYDHPAGWQPREDPRGPLEIWELPDDGAEYVVGADVAECLDDASDYDSAVVRRLPEQRIVATLRGHWEPGEFARLLAALGWYYGEALLAVERNSMGVAVVGALRGRLGGPELYRNLYRYVRVDKLTGKREMVYGFRTDAATKAAAVEAQQRLLREAAEECWSAPLLREALAFVHLGRGRMGAASGGHDDLVTAWCISAYAAEDPRLAPITPEQRAERRIESLLEAVDEGEAVYSDDLAGH